MAHDYRVSVAWRDDPATADYRSYTREHVVTAEGRPPLDGSTDRSFQVPDDDGPPVPTGGERAGSDVEADQ